MFSINSGYNIPPCHRLKFSSLTYMCLPRPHLPPISPALTMLSTAYRLFIWCKSNPGPLRTVVILYNVIISLSISSRSLLVHLAAHGIRNRHLRNYTAPDTSLKTVGTFSRSAGLSYHTHRIVRICHLVTSICGGWLKKCCTGTLSEHRCLIAVVNRWFVTSSALLYWYRLDINSLRTNAQSLRKCQRTWVLIVPLVQICYYCQVILLFGVGEKKKKTTVGLKVGLLASIK